MDINYEFRKGILFVRCEGIISLDNMDILSKRLDYFINNKGVRYFVINLEKATIVNNDFYEVLSSKYRDVKLHDGKLIVCGYDKSFLTSSCSIIHTDNELSAFKLIEV